MSSSWTVHDIPFDRIDLSATRAREDLLYLVAAASFIEIASDLYTRNLAEYYRGDSEVVGWLEGVWEHEELQHGDALKTYVTTVWPEFDWHQAYDGFFAEYSLLCNVEHLEPTRGLEMVARCVIEMGTSCYYRALEAVADEPVLALLADRIQTDEVGHFKYFLRFFNTYKGREKLSRWRILRALTKRVFEASGDDAEIALWHAFHVRQPTLARDSTEFRTIFGNATRAIRMHFPSAMAVKMLTKPLDLPPLVQRGLETPLAALTERLILR